MVNEQATKVTNELLRATPPLQTLAKGDKLTITVERADGGKLRCTGATWDDAVRGPSRRGGVGTPSISGPSDRGGRHPPISVRTISRALPTPISARTIRGPPSRPPPRLLRRRPPISASRGRR
jgi:hypothetical protein